MPGQAVLVTITSHTAAFRPPPHPYPESEVTPSQAAEFSPGPWGRRVKARLLIRQQRAQAGPYKGIFWGVGVGVG